MYDVIMTDVSLNLVFTAYFLKGRVRFLEREAHKNVMSQ